MKEENLILIVINGLCEGGILPSVLTLCDMTGHTTESIKPLLDILLEQQKIQWIDNDLLITLPHPQWYINKHSQLTVTS